MPCIRYIVGHIPLMVDMQMAVSNRIYELMT